MIKPDDIISFWAEVTNRFESDEMALSNLGILLFQSMRGIQNGFDSRAFDIFNPILKTANPAAEKIINSSNRFLFDHVVRQNTKEFLECLLDCPMSGRRVRILTSLLGYKEKL